MMNQLVIPLEQPIIERIAQRFSEHHIFVMLYRGWIPEIVADYAIKRRRELYD
jgi:hypothetical protein